MTNPKPLREIKLQAALEDKQSMYLTNSDLQKAIKIPSGVSKAIIKIRSSVALSDILAHAILLRASSPRDEGIVRNWIEFPGHLFPQTRANIIFSKFLRTIFIEIENDLTEKELESLIHFFAKCPHGYKIPTDLIWSHHEIKASIT